jgi:hypothetical protein
MPGVYDHIFEEYRVVDAENRPLENAISVHARWLEPPGCVFQRNDFHLTSDVRSRGIVKPGLYLSIILEGEGEGGPRDQAHRIQYAENQMRAMAVRAPTPCGGAAPRGTHIRAAGLAFPMPSIARLALDREFLELFRTTDRDVVTMALRAPPRLQAIAMECCRRPSTARPASFCSARRPPRCWRGRSMRCAIRSASKRRPIRSGCGCRPPRI